MGLNKTAYANVTQNTKKNRCKKWQRDDLRMFEKYVIRFQIKTTQHTDC